MEQKKVYPVPPSFAAKAHINLEKYQAMYQRSVQDPEAFWAEQARTFIDWFKLPTQACSGNFQQLNMQWFSQGQLNVAYNCLDRHLETRGQQAAIIWEGDNPQETQTISYAELQEKVCRFANVLKRQGIKKGDRVCIYLPMIPEIAITMLACARIGAVHSVVFAGFSSEALKTRILDADCCLLITADEGLRTNKIVPLKHNVDHALEFCPHVKKVIVVKRTGSEINWQQKRDLWYHELMQEADSQCQPEIMDAQDPLFILYTSGSTGKPKGVLHATGGYAVYAAITHKYIFDYHDGDIYWCTADAGWITGHTYFLYGPLLNGATTVMFEGVPSYPDFSRFWQIIDKHQVNIFYTAPTAIRALRREGDQWVTHTSRKSLKLLGTVGEPINPDVWEWYYRVVGEGRCPVVDTWWQTETGGILITPLPGATPLKPGSAGWPFFGIVPAIIDDKGNKVASDQPGKLVITQPWPGLMQTIYGDHPRFLDNYFKEFSGNYLTGDGAHCDAEGYYWITGRNDDVIKVSGHRIGTEEVESALLTHAAVSEAAVVGIPDRVKGEAIYAYVTTKANIIPSESLKKELIERVRSEIGGIAIPQVIQWTGALPKTRSGKIMRRILRKIACDEFEQLGDTSTLADPTVVDELIAERKKLLV